MNSASAALLIAVRGPILLITLGILLLIHKGAGPSVFTTWPVLVILFGLLKLLEMLAARSVSVDGPGPMGGPGATQGGMTS